MDSTPEQCAALRDLTSRMARGDDAAWREFHEQHGPELFRFLLAATNGDPHLAADAVQHTYLRIARHVRPCDSPVMWRSWTRTVARSALADLRRQENRFVSLLRRWWIEPQPAPAEPDDNAPYQALESGLQQLDATARGLLEAKYLRGEEVRAIAAQLGISPKAVESRLTRARAALRAQLTNPPADERLSEPRT